jgi:addiction module HigA family antidote
MEFAMIKKLSPIHPGEILLEEFMKPLALNANKLSLALRVPANRIQMIVAGERGISSETALRLGRYFGTSPEFWMNLQASYDIRLAKQEMQAQIEKEVQPRETAA